MDDWYKTVLENLPVVVYVDSSGEGNAAVYVSPLLEDMLGYAREEWLTDAGLWRRIVHPDDLERTLAEATRVREDGEPFSLEYRLLAKDSSVVWVRDESSPVFGSDGEIMGWQGIMLDITESKHYEEDLRRSEERHRLVTRATGEAIWDNDLMTGRQEWDGATEALFGYLPNEAGTGAWWEKRIHPGDRDRILSSLEALYRDGVDEWEEAYRFGRSDGSYADVEDRGYVVRDEVGEPMRMVGAMKDVTGKRESEKKLRESEARFRLAFEAAAVGMAHVSADGRWSRVNREFREIVGRQ